jgi:imidazole glycerol-phosphate synthase subunit HisH
MSVVIIDYGSGNLRSAAKAFERAVAEAGLDLDVRVSDRAGDVERASRVVLPGVGAFADCKRGLEAVPGMVEALERTVLEKARPFLGICVGMQLMATIGREHGDHPGLAWIDGEVVPLEPDDAALPIPHMGWNDLTMSGAHPFFDGIPGGSHVYFVHSFALHCGNPENVLATVDYGGSIAAVIGRDNMLGTQFHPEKSQATGLRLITNFLKWRP